MEAAQAQHSPDSEAAAAAPLQGVSSSSGTALQPTQSTGILDLPDDLVERILLEALTKDPSAFKLLLLVCRSWAASAPVLHVHPRIREDARIPGTLLAEGMARLSGVVSLQLQRRSVRGLLPTVITPSEAAGDLSRQQAPWTANLKSLTVDHVEFVPADPSLAFPNLTDLSLTFSDARAEEPSSLFRHRRGMIGRGLTLPRWVENSFPPRLESLRLRNVIPDFLDSLAGPAPEYRGFPPSLTSLHLSVLSDQFISSSLGELARLKRLTIVDCAFHTLPESIGDLRQLQHLTLSQCTWLATLPESISNLVSLTSLRLPLSEFRRLPNLGSHLQQSLLVFQVSDYYEGNDSRQLSRVPSDLGLCLNIRTLHLQSCKIKRIPDLGGLSSLRDLLVDLPKLKELPDIFWTMSSLKSVRILCMQLSAVPPSLTASTSSSLEVLHIVCEGKLVLPSLTCPPSLLELKLVGKIVRSPQAYTAAGTLAHHGPSHVILNPAIKKVHITSCHVRVEGAGASLEELALFCDKKSCHGAGMTHGDIWGEGEVPSLPSLTRLILWCGAEDQNCYHSWVTRLAPLPGLRVLQIGPHRRPRAEAEFSLSQEGHPNVEALKLHNSDYRTPSSLPSLLTCLSAAGGVLTRMKDLVLSDYNLTEAPAFLEELRGLVSFTVRGCYELRRLRFPPTWTSLESLRIFRCPQLRLQEDMLQKLLSLKTLVLGCRAMSQLSPSLETLQQLTSFEVVRDGDCHRDHVCKPLNFWSLPSLKRVKAPVECLRELPSAPIPPSVESLDLGDVGRILCLPPAEGSGLPRQMKQDLGEARERLRSLTELRTDALPVLHWDCLTQLTSLHVKYLRQSPSGLHLSSNLDMLKQLTHLKVSRSDIEAIPREVAFLPCLLELELESCYLLHVIHGASDGYLRLKKISIRGCPRLVDRYPVFTARLRLSVGGCLCQTF